MATARSMVLFSASLAVLAVIFFVIQVSDAAPSSNLSRVKRQLSFVNAVDNNGTDPDWVREYARIQYLNDHASHESREYPRHPGHRWGHHPYRRRHYDRSDFSDRSDDSAYESYENARYRSLRDYYYRWLTVAGK